MIKNILLITMCSISVFGHYSEDVQSFKNNFNGITLFYTDPHPAVTSSIIRGLTTFDIPFTINPKNAEAIKDVVFCLQDVKWLKRCIKYKNKGITKKLIVGPNMFGRSSADDHIILNSAIDLYLTPCEWNKIAHIQDEPEVSKIIEVWPAGINAHFWNPQSLQKNTNLVLIYWKTEPQAFCDQVKSLLEKYGWQPIIIKYGSYHVDHYKNLLNQVKFAVFISVSESQGIALAESWAMNVPTLAWDPQRPIFYCGKCFDPVNSCPYLCDKTGRRWNKLDELESLLQNIDTYWSEFSPRQWVLDNMTDAISIALLLKLISQGSHEKH